VVNAIGPELYLVVDGGPTRGGLPSTIVDVTSSEPRLLRAGPVAWERVLESLE
jgi:tRNA A37 threonylcarbamoyladenosine synthetase subunit TsaC/SUA5/YrdC